MDNGIFDVLILLARPAAGKSEIIHFLKGLNPQDRKLGFHLGRMTVIDDFPMLWSWFEEDALLTGMNQERLHTTEDGYFKATYLWDLLIERISLEYQKLIQEQGFHDQNTVVVEFSRGSEHGGYGQAFEHLSLELLQRAAILYVDVSFAESMRKNRRRRNPDKPHSILEHSLDDDKMERLYRETDWQDISRGNPTHLHSRGIAIPYVVFDNEQDITTRGGDTLAHRLQSCLESLWQLYKK